MAASYETSTTKTPKKQRIRTVIRNAKEQDWIGINAIPDKGELVYASDVNTLKIGDGTTTYDNLPAISGGEQGTTNYTDLTNKPEINGVTLVGNVSLSNLGLANVASTGEYSDLVNTPVLGTMAAENASDYTKTSSLSNVALTGSYDDLVNKPVFGTAAFANTTDFATAAQGDLANTAVQPTDLANVATTGNYNDLTNKPTIPAAQVNADWNATSGVAEILNKPTLSTVATTGEYSDLLNKPTLANVATSGDYNDLTNTPSIPSPQVNSDWNATSGVAEILNKPTLSMVATTGEYSDLLNTPVLGTAAYANTTDFATAAEGNLATTAVQPGDLANVATTGSYDDLINKPYIPAGVVVDLTYDPLSINAAAGTAVAEAVANKQDTLINGTNIKSINGNTLLGSGDLTLDSLPDQTGQSGKYLTTNGTTASWNSLANVAISGSYDDLVNTPVFGSMAYANTSDYTVTANLSNVALSGEYSDLLNTPVIPAAQVQTDWDATSGMGVLLNKPTLANVALSGEYNDLVNTPVIPTVDQVYNSLSTNAQSGTAVSEAVSAKSNVVLREW